MRVRDLVLVALSAGCFSKPPAPMEHADAGIHLDGRAMSGDTLPDGTSSCLLRENFDLPTIGCGPWADASGSGTVETNGNLVTTVSATGAPVNESCISRNSVPLIGLRIEVKALPTTANAQAYVVLHFPSDSFHFNIVSRGNGSWATLASTGAGNADGNDFTFATPVLWFQPLGNSQVQVSQGNGTTFPSMNALTVLGSTATFQLELGIELDIDGVNEAAQFDNLDACVP